MLTLASLSVRWSRASLLGAAVLAAGVVAHASAGGLLPGLATMVTMFTVLASGCAALLGREASTPRLVAIMVGGQAFVHAVLSATAGHQTSAAVSIIPTDATPVVPWDPRSGESYDQWASQAVGGQPGGGLAIPGWLMHSVGDMVAHPAMAATHVLAAAAVGLWLAIGERALWLLLRIACSGIGHLAAWVAARLGGLAALQLRCYRPVRPGESFILKRPGPRVWALGPVRRGPPHGLLAH